MNIDKSVNYLGSNLKMANDRAATMALLDAAKKLSELDGRQLFFFPSMVFLAEAVQRVAGSSVLIGSQGCSPHASGAFTGEVSATMLTDVGVQTVMVGHYERVLAGERLATFIMQAIRAQEVGLRVLCCLGERTKARSPSDASDLLKEVEEYKSALVNRPWLLAYEPHWTIGEQGVRPDIEYVEARLSALRTGLNEEGWNDVPLVYGGSVDEKNAVAIDALTACDGLFVGRAAWTPNGLIRISENLRSMEDV